MKFEKATVFAQTGPNAVSYDWEPNDEECKLLKKLVKKGLVLSSSRFGGLGFAELVKGAKGRLPFTVKLDKQGDYDTMVHMEDGDDIVVANVQQWSVINAYKLGYKEGKKA